MCSINGFSCVWGLFSASMNPFEMFKSVENEECGVMQDSLLCYTNLEIEPDEGTLVVKASPALLNSTKVLVDGLVLQ